MSSGAIPPGRQPDYRKRDQASLLITTENATGGHEYIEEREQEEYYYVHSRPGSEASEGATINFLTDDRVERPRGGREPYEEIEEIHESETRWFKEQHHRSHEPPRDQRQRAPPPSGYYGPPTQRPVGAEYREEQYQQQRREARDYREEQQHREQQRGMSVDYSAQDFQHSRSVIDEAARRSDESRRGEVRVRQIGDTTIMTEHRDPYSFYWQLDQFKKQEEPPARRLPPADYVVDEEEILPPQETTVLSPDSHDSGIQFESQYSKPHKEERPLPAGWEKHEDPSGFSYYWHVDSGTITREPPKPPPPHITPPLPVQDDYTMTDKIPSPPPIIQQLPPPQPIIEEHAFKQTTTKRRVENEQESDQEFIEEDRKPVRFVVRSLGWTEIAEEELTAEKSSRAVNLAIIELSTGLMDNVAKWGDGRELIMELDDNELSLIDPDTMTVVHAEKIQQIRVWGVGRDNGRDFAYVARDRNSRRFLCHVFRCDTPARTIANTLRDICKRLMLQRRPTSLNGTVASERRVTKESLLTPIDEPKKVIRCHFLGVTQVPRATGIDILNEAVNRLVSQVRPERWILADVSIAPSTITINEVGGGQIAQCRVRYLSFLGIGQDVKHCAFIMHTSTENFMCYVFHVEPSAGAMAKTIEAACKLRYQKVLDAHAGRRSATQGSQLNGKD